MIQYTDVQRAALTLNSLFDKGWHQLKIELLSKTVELINKQQQKICKTLQIFKAFDKSQFLPSENVSTGNYK